MNRPKPSFYILSVLMVLMVCFAYWNHFNNPFHFDDEHTIVTNTYIRDIHNIPLFFKDATTFSSLPANQAWRPGISTLDAIDCWIGSKGECMRAGDGVRRDSIHFTEFLHGFGKGPCNTKSDPIPYYYHVHIFIDYLILAFFIYLFALKIYDLAFKNDLNRYIALLTTAVFMLHTGNAETINYIISRSDSDSTLMIMITLCMFVYIKGVKRYFLYLIPMFIGFMIKEPTVMVAPIMFVYIYLFEEERSFKQILDFKTDFSILWRVLPAFLLAVGLFAFSQLQTPDTHSLGGTDRWAYMKTETFVMVHYVSNYFFPFDLSADTDWGLITSIFDHRVVIGTLFILLTLGLAVWASFEKKSRPIAFGILWFYLALVPTSSVVPFSEVLNDHRVFFPYIGLTMAFVWALFLLYKKYEEPIGAFVFGRPVIYMGIGLFLCAHTYGVRERSKIWSDEALLWKDVTVKSPHNGRGLMNYGLVLMGKGDYKGAMEYYNLAKTEWPYYSYIYVNLGVIYSVQNNPVESEKNFKYALSLNSQNPNCYFYYAIMLKNNNRIPEAQAMIKKGLALSPRHVDLLRFDAELNTSVRDRIESAEKTAKQNPTAENYLNLSLVYYNNSRYLDCVHAAQEAARINPKYDAAYNNICSAYNMLHDWDNAIAAGRKAIEINPTNQQAKNNLALSLDAKNRLANAESAAKQKPSPENYLNLSLAYYNEGRYLDCVHACEQALKLKPDYDLAYNNICSAYNMLHDYDNAIAAGKKAVALSPNSQLAKNNLQAAIDGKKGK